MKHDDVRIAEPCTVDWKSMTPAEGGRFCADCKKVVRNLSQLTEREAKKLLRTANDGNLCVRYVYDAQGKIFFGADAPRPDMPASALLSRVKRVAAGAALAVVAQACGGQTVDDASSTPVEPGTTSSSSSSGYVETMGAAPYVPAADAGDDDTDAGPDTDTSALDGGAAPDAATN